MKTWHAVIGDALNMLVHSDRYAYFYGAKGQKLTPETMEALWNAEPEYFKRYTQKQKDAIFKYSNGKIGFDCSGFIAHLTGCNTWSGAIWDRCRDKTTPKNGPAASILWKPGHVALDIGYGYGVEMGVEKSSVVLFRIADHDPKFEGSGRLKAFIDYEGATNR